MAKSWKSRKKSRRTVSSRQRYARTLRCEHLEDRRLLAVVTVDTDQDIVDFNDGVTSLREAIFATNLVDGADEIVFDFGQDGPATILLTQGELAVTDSLTINGPGASLLTIDASGNDPTPDENNGDGSRVFNIDDGGFNNLIQVTLAGLTLTGGDNNGKGGAISSKEELSIFSSTLVDNSSRQGGAVSSGDDLSNMPENRALLIIVDSRIVGNNSRSGGGIFSLAEMKITGSTISDNQSRCSGGGIFARSVFGFTQDFEIVDSTISNNTAGDRGGGFYIFGIGSRIDSSTIDNNTGRTGGGIFVTGSVEIVNSTVSKNTSFTTGGGVLSNWGDLILRHVTVTDNDSKEGGGIYARSPRPGQVTTLDHVIVAGNRSEQGGSPDLFGRSLAVSYSLIGDNTGLILPEAPIGSPDANGNLIGGEMYGVIDPMLGELADNGGPTQTHALLSGSPAINRGDLNAVAGIDGVPKFDQRGDGFDRVFGGRIDIGAYEVQELSDLNLLVDTLDDESDGDFSRGNLSLREAIELANANPVADTINFDTTLTGGTILLTQGELAITDSVEIIGLGAELLTIDASGNDPTPDQNNGDGSRVFNIDDGNEDRLISVNLSGMALTGGDVADKGGAIFSSESLVVGGSKIYDNYARRDGGGISVVADNNGVVQINDVTVTGNFAEFGGGIHARLYGSSKMTVLESEISENSADFIAGGIRIFTQESSAFELRSSNVSGNHARRLVGGISLLARDNSTVVIELSQFEENMVTENYRRFGAGGSSILAYGSAVVLIKSSMFTGNVLPESGGVGAGIRVITRNASRVEIQQSTVSGNVAKGSNGGGIYASVLGSGSIHIESTTISGNQSQGSGGGVYVSSPGSNAIRIDHSTITDNLSDSNNDGEGKGGGIFVSRGSINLDHTIVAGNDDNSGAAPTSRASSAAATASSVPALSSSARSPTTADPRKPTLSSQAAPRSMPAIPMSLTRPSLISVGTRSHASSAGVLILVRTSRSRCTAISMATVTPTPTISFDGKAITAARVVPMVLTF